MAESLPRWVKVFGIVAGVLIVLFAVLHLTGNTLGGHAMPVDRPRPAADAGH